MAKSRARRNSNAPGIFHSWAKRWRGPAHRKCSICNPVGGRRPAARTRKAQRDAAINEA